MLQSTTATCYTTVNHSHTIATHCYTIIIPQIPTIMSQLPTATSFLHWEAQLVISAWCTQVPPKQEVREWMNGQMCGSTERTVKGITASGFHVTCEPASFYGILTLPGPVTLQRAWDLVLKQQRGLAPRENAELSLSLLSHLPVGNRCAGF